jgi:hypothetical protein
MGVEAENPTTIRMEKFAADAAEGPIGEPIERLRASATWERGADALLANDIALMFLMVQQPGLTATLAVTLLANAVPLGYRLLRRRHAAVPAPAPPVALR